MAKQRIDVHTHLIPPFWAEELKSCLIQNVWSAADLQVQWMG